MQMYEDEMPKQWLPMYEGPGMQHATEELSRQASSAGSLVPISRTNSHAGLPGLGRVLSRQHTPANPGFAHFAHFSLAAERISSCRQVPLVGT